MNKLRLIIAYILLLALSWVVIPVHSIHDLFADHEDTADNFCLVNHSHLGTHIEVKHTHCDVLKLNTPTYKAPELVHVNITRTFKNATYVARKIQKLAFQSTSLLPSRAPPLA